MPRVTHRPVVKADLEVGAAFLTYFAALARRVLRKKA